MFKYQPHPRTIRIRLKLMIPHRPPRRCLRNLSIPISIYRRREIQLLARPQVA